ncbi:hypothetical protein Lepto7375DRAFT_0888 [Leptolyngbya sp. PCC 7375]|nr:hypothetical protein Lepto7375DRAFT_0888 [Leptolyngbya sp. PCC 7375]
MSELDGLPVASLMERYGVNRSQIYVRLDAIKKIDPSLVPVRRGRRSFVSSELLGHLDSIAALLQQGLTTDEAAEQVLGATGQSSTQPDVWPDSLARQDSSDLSTRDLIGLLLANAQRPVAPKDRLAMFKDLQAIVDHDWRPSTSQLCEILELSSLSGNEFERYGFRFIRQGKNGTESAWKVERA